MNQCTFCRTHLPTPADEFGHPDIPSCFNCWTAESLPCPNDNCQDGKVLCEFCGGEGHPYFEPHIECPDCEGTGFWYCDVCDGRGHITAEDTFNKATLRAPGSPLLYIDYDILETAVS